MDSELWFNISRIVLIVAGLFTAVGGSGVLYFGKINSHKQNEKIAESNKIAAEANKDAAIANKIAATANKEAEKAKEDALIAKAKTIDNENKNKALELALEREKQLTLKAKKELEELKKETRNLKIGTDRLQSIRIQFSCVFKGDLELNPKRDFYKFNDIVGAQLYLKSKGETVFAFIPDQFIRAEKIGDGFLHYQITYLPIDELNYYRQQIEVLNSIDELQLNLQKELITTKPLLKFKQLQKSTYSFTLYINEIIVLDASIVENYLGEFLMEERQQFKASHVFENTYSLYKEKIGRDDN